jgi:hypothetical protein
LDGDELGVADGASDGDELGASEGDNWGCGGAIHPRSSSCSEGRNQRRIKTKQGGIKQGAGYGRRARLTLSYKQARVRLCGRSAVGLLTMSVDCEFVSKQFRSKYFGGVMTLPPGKEKEVDGEREYL